MKQCRVRLEIRHFLQQIHGPVNMEGEGISPNEPAPSATERLSVGIGFVKMPSYLLRNSMAVRNGANEIEYIEDAQWAERLDHCFQLTLVANLSRLLSSNGIYLTDWGRGQVQARVFINVQ